MGAVLIPKKFVPTKAPCATWLVANSASVGRVAGKHHGVLRVRVPRAAARTNSLYSHVLPSAAHLIDVNGQERLDTVVLRHRFKERGRRGHDFRQLLGDLLVRHDLVVHP